MLPATPTEKTMISFSANSASETDLLIQRRRNEKNVNMRANVVGIFESDAPLGDELLQPFRVSSRVTLRRAKLRKRFPFSVHLIEDINRTKLSVLNEIEIDSGGAQTGCEFLAQSSHRCQYAAGTRLPCRNEHCLIAPGRRPTRTGI